MSIPLVYFLHSGNLYGTERMALATLEGLQSDFIPICCSPPGLVLEQTKRQGIQTYTFTNTMSLMSVIRELLTRYTELAILATGIKHSLLLSISNTVYRRKLRHFQMVHGGTDERDSYARKRFLNALPIDFIANSQFVRSRLLAYHVPAARIHVIENFLPPDYCQTVPKRPPFEQTGIQKIIVVSRVDPIKRIDVLLDALEYVSSLNQLTIHILGTGWDFHKMRDHARERHPNVTFLGFVNDVPQRLIQADLFVHLCPVEPFGLAILEAMAAQIPVLVPDSGGAADLVEENLSGFHFRANDPHDLATRLLNLMDASPEQLNRVVSGAQQVLETRFSANVGLAKYRTLLLSKR